jgi:PAS domain S-box-containing protein
MIEDLYNNAPCGYHSLDKDGLVVSMNDTELKWLGLSRDDVVGKLNITSILTKESLGKFNALFPSFMLTGTIHDVELEFITCSGKILPVFVSETAIYDDSGTYVKSRSTVLDFTDVKQVREELIKKAYQLEDANHELEAFTYSVSHDLRAPLRAISGFTQILEQDFLPVLDEKGKNVVDTILQNTRRMYQLIDDLLAFSRVGRTTLQVTRVDMYDMAAECVEELTANIRVKPVVMVDSTLPVLLADRSLIRQVWLNLLANAIKFSSRNPSPVITISCSIIECYATFSVADNGVGFDMKYKDKLFGVFQRLHSQKEFEGTGVGLAIVQRIILRHGGTVWAESKPDMGAVFHFSLKINPDE